MHLILSQVTTAGNTDGGMAEWRDDGMEGWQDGGGMAEWRDGGMSVQVERSKREGF